MRNLGSRRSRTGIIIDDDFLSRRFRAFPVRRYPVRLEEDMRVLDRATINVIYIDDRDAINEYLDKVKDEYRNISKILNTDKWYNLEDFTDAVTAQMVAYALLCGVCPNEEQLKATMERYHGRPVSDDEVSGTIVEHQESVYEDLYLEEEAGGMSDITTGIWSELTGIYGDDDDTAYEIYDDIYRTIVETIVFDYRMTDVILDAIYGAGVELALTYDGKLQTEPLHCYTNLLDGYITLRLGYEILDRRIH